MCRRKRTNKAEGTKAPEIPKPGQVNLFKLFKFCSPGEKFLVFMGIVSSALSGALSPVIAIVMGKTVELFEPATT